MVKELKRYRNQSGDTLSSITRRFSAIDARYLKQTDARNLRLEYSLADQLTVEPKPQLSINATTKSRMIKMTQPEVAVALSHIEVWKLIASSDAQYALILEDDVYFGRGFAKEIDAIWASITELPSSDATFDILYLSYKEVEDGQIKKVRIEEHTRKPARGIWYASGYVLSKQGALKLLGLLPMYGPVDLWLNLQFSKLDVLLAKKSIIEQRVDTPSTNSYSIMPVLSQVGVYNYERPLVTHAHKLIGPVFAFGAPGSGLTSLATALSMIGYTCCSDISQLPDAEHVKVFNKKTGRLFNAYVNIGAHDDNTIMRLARLYPTAKFIFTSLDNALDDDSDALQRLRLPKSHPDKWSLLSDFLNIEYPAFPYPAVEDVGQRKLIVRHNTGREGLLPYRHRKFDASPWVLTAKNWKGISLLGSEQDKYIKASATWNGKRGLSQTYWKLRDDTFPSNLALFRPHNVTINEKSLIEIKLRKQQSTVRAYSSGAIVSQGSYLYGSFAAELRPSNVPGLITSIFLHRNSPHQEIDIEFLGKDPTKMLVNVFYNPGVSGTKLEYGYRGTPTAIELGFDASKEFHKYEIVWLPQAIQWLVDGRIIYERIIWDPTPIPNLPLEFNINLWHSRSKEFAGKLNNEMLPAKTFIKKIEILAGAIDTTP